MQNKKNTVFVGILLAGFGVISSNIIAEPMPVGLYVSPVYTSEKDVRDKAKNKYQGWELLACNAGIDDYSRTTFEYARDNPPDPITQKGLGFGPFGSIIHNPTQLCSWGYATHLHVGGLNPSPGQYGHEDNFCSSGVLQCCEEVHAYSYAHYAPGAQIIQYYQADVEGIRPTTLKTCVMPPSSTTYNLLADISEGHFFSVPGHPEITDCCILGRVVDHKPEGKVIGDKGYFTSGEWQCLAQGATCGLGATKQAIEIRKRSIVKSIIKSNASCPVEQDMSDITTKSTLPPTEPPDHPHWVSDPQSDPRAAYYQDIKMPFSSYCECTSDF